jgi:hypothetical protein
MVRKEKYMDREKNTPAETGAVCGLGFCVEELGN